MNEMIRSLACQCPHCGRELEYAPEEAETEIACGACNQALTLPPVGNYGTRRSAPQIRKKKSARPLVVIFLMGGGLLAVGAIIPAIVFLLGAILWAVLREK